VSIAGRKKLLLKNPDFGLIDMGRILIFAMLFPFGTLAQERISLVTDRDIYFTGDMIWLSAACTADAGLSKILLVELIDGRATYAKAKLPIENGRVAGAIRIPEGLAGKNYQLRAYTNWQRNFPPESYCTRQLTILNPATPLPNPMQAWRAQVEGERKCEIAVQGLKDRHLPREKVALSLSSPETMDVAVAVVKKGVAPGPGPIHSSAHHGPLPKTTISPALLPDIRDVSLSGVLEDSASGTPVKGGWVYASVIGGGGQQLHVYQTDENGVFVFPLNHLTGMQKIAVSAELGNKVRIHADFSDRYAAFPEVGLAPDTTLRQLFEEVYINSQLERKYHPVQTDSALLPAPVGEWFGRPAASVVLKDFVALPAMEDVFSEIVPYVSVRKKSRQFHLWVLDREETGFDPSPLVLIDNVPVFDLDALMQVNPALVTRIEVINEPYMLGSHSISSLISVTTATSDFAGLKFPPSTVFLNYQTREASLAFPAARPESGESHIPDFRTVLYWNPHVKLGTGAELIEFYTSDHESEYQLLVRGWDELGEEVYWEKTFSVGKD
jgi:hypothetical protein